MDRAAGETGSDMTARAERTIERTTAADVLIDKRSSTARKPFARRARRRLHDT